jgi:hypothetical protein
MSSLLALGDAFKGSSYMESQVMQEAGSNNSIRLRFAAKVITVMSAALSEKRNLSAVTRPLCRPRVLGFSALRHWQCVEMSLRKL